MAEENLDQGAMSVARKCNLQAIPGENWINEASTRVVKCDQNLAKNESPKKFSEMIWIFFWRVSNLCKEQNMP